jgi:hypothetical protein
MPKAPRHPLLVVVQVLVLVHLDALDQVPHVPRLEPRQVIHLGSHLDLIDGRTAQTHSAKRWLP